MSFTVSGLAAYIDNQQFPLIAQLQTSSSTAALVTKQTGIKKTSNLHFLSTDVVFQDGNNCTRSASGTTTLTERSITVGDIAVYEDLCAKALIGKYTQIEMQIGNAGDKVLPGMVEEIYLKNKMEKLKAQLDVSDWNGNTASGTNNLSYYDGWIKQIDAGSPVAGNTGSLTSITVSNIITAAQNMFLAMPTNIQEKTDLSLFMPRAWYNLYVVALINANLYHYVGDSGVAMLHGTNVALRPTDGLASTNRMFLTYNENLVVGMDGDADEDVMGVRLDPVTQKNIFFDLEFKRGTSIYFIDEVVEFTLSV